MTLEKQKNENRVVPAHLKKKNNFDKRHTHVMTQRFEGGGE